MNSENILRESLAATADCPPLPELLEVPHQAALQAHIAACPHCQTELALASHLQQPADAAVVLSISRRLAQVNWADAGRTGIVEPARSFWHKLFHPRLLAPASLALATVMGLVTVVQMRHPGSKETFHATPREIGSQELRSQRVRGLFPLGLVSSAPKLCSWEPMQSAVQYEIRLMEVDHTPVWQQRVYTNNAKIPVGEVSKMLPGRRMLWEVTALGQAGQALATSGTLEFTVSLHPANK